MKSKVFSTHNTQPVTYDWVIINDYIIANIYYIQSYTKIIQDILVDMFNYY